MTDIVDERSKRPRCKGFGCHAEPKGIGSVLTATGDNPFCGDSIEIHVFVENAPDGSVTIAGSAFDGYACSLCTAASDVLLEHIEGMDADEALAVSYDELIGLLGDPRVGRTRSGCVRLPLTVLKRALAPLSRPAEQKDCLL